MQQGSSGMLKGRQAQVAVWHGDSAVVKFYAKMQKVKNRYSVAVCVRQCLSLPSKQQQQSGEQMGTVINHNNGEE